MEIFWHIVILHKFLASIDMLENAMRLCPDDLWIVSMWNDPDVPPGFSAFWYVAYHTIFWLDLYLSGAAEGFSPPAPFTLDELDPAGLLPDRVYSPEELLAYLDHCRQKCHTTIEALTDEDAGRQCEFPWGSLSFGELLLDNMRHVQEHGAQLSLFLGQQKGLNARWLAKPR